MRIISLGGLVIFVCSSVILGMFLIARFVIFILPSSLTSLIIVVDGLRLILAATLAYAWLRVWKNLTDWYFWRSVKSQKA